jgi:DNA-binding LacI/PurR family transcriptional regulator
MPPIATLQDVAARAGVHRSTVSLALRDHPRISVELRREIQALAMEMGYRINPLVAALMRSRRTGHGVKHVTLAYVTCFPTRWGWRPPQHDRPDYFPGAQARAELLGYRLEHFWLGEPGMTPERFCAILQHRGISGLLIGRLPPERHDLNLRWSSFACVALGFTLHQPSLHRVAEDFFDSAWVTIERCQAAGYRRLGFAFFEPDDSPRVADRWLGAYGRYQLSLEPELRLQPFRGSDGARVEEAFRQWFQQQRPDALLVTHVNPAMQWLERMGVRVPDDVAVATVVNDHPERGCAGVHCDPGKVGAVATDLLVSLLQRGETGLPSDPQEVLLTGKWVGGSTLPPRAIGTVEMARPLAIVA